LTFPAVPFPRLPLMRFLCVLLVIPTKHSRGGVKEVCVHQSPSFRFRFLNHPQQWPRRPQVGTAILPSLRLIVVFFFPQLPSPPLAHPIIALPPLSSFSILLCKWPSRALSLILTLFFFFLDVWTLNFSRAPPLHFKSRHDTSEWSLLLKLATVRP